MSSYGPTLLRITLGAIYLMQAYLALFVTTPTGAATFIAKLGFPLPTVLALGLIVVHGAGGVMLVLGIWARLAAAANAVVLLLAILASYLRQGTVLRVAVLDAAAGRAAPAGYEYILLLVATTVALAWMSGGARGGGRSK